LVLRSGEQNYLGTCTGKRNALDSRLEILSLSEWRSQLSSRIVFPHLSNSNGLKMPPPPRSNGESIYSSRLKFVHLPFDHPLLHIQDREIQQLQDEETIRKEVLKMFRTASLSQDYKPGEAGTIREFCINDQKRSLMLAKLAAQRPKNAREGTNAALKILGACGAAANKRQSAEADIVLLATNTDTPIFVREQALISLMDLNCPADDTLFELHRLTGSQTGEIYEAAMLTLGALLRQRKRCKGASDEHGARLRSTLNMLFKEAVSQGNPDRIETSLLAFANSGSDHHIEAIAHSFSIKPDLMRSINLKHSATTALQSIKEMGSNEVRLQSLLSDLAEPSRSEKASLKNSIRNAIEENQHQSVQRQKWLSQTLAWKFKDPQILKIRHKFSSFMKRFTNLYNKTKSQSLEEEDIDEIPDPRECQPGKTEMLAIEKRIPQNGVVRGFLGVSGGIGEGQYADDKKTCVKYGYAEAKAAVEIFTGVDISGLNPLSMDIIKLSGRILSGAKCPCPPKKKKGALQKFRLKVFGIAKKYGPKVARKTLKKLSKNAAKGDIDLCPSSCKNPVFKLGKGLNL
jgi:hypothetical protein